MLRFTSAIDIENYRSVGPDLISIVPSANKDYGCSLVNIMITSFKAGMCMEKLTSTENEVFFAVNCNTDDITIYHVPLPDVKKYGDISLTGSETPTLLNPAVRCLCHQA